MSVVNQMRADPPAFADVLDDMRRNRSATAHGYSNTDPVWQDLRQAIADSLVPSNVPAALTLLRQTNPLPPLTWEDSLRAESANHNAWMQTTCFAHSTPEGSSASPCIGAFPGLTYNPQRAANNPDYIGENTLGDWSSGAFNENIGYQSGPSMPQTRAAYSVGSDAHRQRQAYYDIVSFVLEFNSGSLGHLQGLLHARRDAIGIAYETLDGFSPTSSDTNFIATHTLSRNASVGAYITGIAHEDANNNGVFDLGEEESGCVTVTAIASSTSTEYCTTATQTGLLSTFLPAGSYLIDGGVARQMIEIDYVSDNQNIDVSAALAQVPLDTAGYAASITGSVQGTHNVAAGTGYQTVMIEAESNANLMINPATSFFDEVWIVDSERVDIAVRNGNTLTASLIAGNQYIIIVKAGDALRRFNVSTTGGRVVTIHTNVLDYADVDTSGDVTPLDALTVINRIAVTTDLTSGVSYYYDTNGDRQLTPRDALNVINAIAARQASAETESVVIEAPYSMTVGFPDTEPSKGRHEEAIDRSIASLGQLF